MRKEILPKSLRRVKHFVNTKVVWDFFRGANVMEKSLSKIRKYKYCSNLFEYKRSTFFTKSYSNLKVGEITGIAICAKSHLYTLSHDWLKAMKTLDLRVFVGILLNKSSNGLVHNISLRCKIAKTFSIMRFKLNSPNVIAFFSHQPTKKSSRHSSVRFRLKKMIARRALHNKYGSYNKK